MSNTVLNPVAAGQQISPYVFPVQGDGVSFTAVLPLGSVPISFSLRDAIDSTGTDVTANVAGSALVGTSILVTFFAPFANVVTLVYVVTGTQPVPVTNITGTATVLQGTIPWVTKVSNFPTYISVSAPNPAPGAVCIITVPASVQWRVRSVFFWITTSVTVASRIATVTAQSVAAGSPPAMYTTASAFSSVAQTASSVWLYSGSNAFSGLSASFGFVTETQISLPNIVLSPGMTLQIGAGFIQPADQISHVALMVEQTAL